MAALEKPDRLYHGSPRRNLNALEPRVSLGSGEKLGRLIYASPNKAIASIFLADVTGRWSAGTIGDVPYALITVPREEFVANDKGGVMYILPSESFVNDERNSLGEMEWVSSKAVTPIEQIHYTSALQAMLDNGVQVYFVSPATLEEINNTSEKKKLLRAIQSENQRTSLNIRTFE